MSLTTAELDAIAAELRGLVDAVGDLVVRCDRVAERVSPCGPLPHPRRPQAGRSRHAPRREAPALDP
jgi:hypothetical protein